MSDLEQVRREGADALAAVRVVLVEPWYDFPAAAMEELRRLVDRLELALGVTGVPGRQGSGGPLAGSHEGAAETPAKTVATAIAATTAAQQIRDAIAALDAAMNALAEVNIDLLTGYLKKLS